MTTSVWGIKLSIVWNMCTCFVSRVEFYFLDCVDLVSTTRRLVLLQLIFWILMLERQWCTSCSSAIFATWFFPFFRPFFLLKMNEKACVTVRLHYYIIDQGVCALVNLTFSNFHIESLHLKCRIKCDDILFWT